MLVGVPKEIKDNEYRVGTVPSTVRELTTRDIKFWSRPARELAQASRTQNIRPPEPRSRLMPMICSVELI